MLTLHLLAEQATWLHDLLAATEPVDGQTGKKSKPGKWDAGLTGELDSAGGLGPITENVRNVASLRPALVHEAYLRLVGDVHQQKFGLDLTAPPDRPGVEP